MKSFEPPLNCKRFVRRNDGASVSSVGFPFSDGVNRAKPSMLT